MQAREIMSEGAFCIASSATVFEAAELLVNSRVSALPVVDETGVDGGHPERGRTSSKGHWWQPGKLAPKRWADLQRMRMPMQRSRKQGHRGRWR